MTDLFINTIGTTTADDQKIIVDFKNGRKATYTKSMISFMMTDRAVDMITDYMTGAIIFYRDGEETYLDADLI